MGCGSSSVAAIEGRAGGVGSDPVVIADFKNKEEVTLQQILSLILHDSLFNLSVPHSSQEMRRP